MEAEVEGEKVRNLSVSILIVLLMLLVFPAFLPLSEPVNPGSGGGHELTSLGWIYIIILICMTVILCREMKK